MSVLDSELKSNANALGTTAGPFFILFCANKKVVPLINTHQPCRDATASSCAAHCEGPACWAALCGRRALHAD
jgi:hypothetical protein